MRRSSFPPTPHIDDALPDLAVGRAIATEEEAHMADCHRCADRFVQLRKRVATSFDTVKDVNALRALLAQTLEQLDTRGDLVQLAPEVGELLDLPEDKAWELLEMLEAASARWSPGPAEGIDLLPLRPGARWRGTQCVALRARPGAKYPRHEHSGSEYQIVLQGGFRVDDDGSEIWRGERMVAKQGTSHSLTILEGPPCIVIVRVEPPFVRA